MFKSALTTTLAIAFLILPFNANSQPPIAKPDRTWPMFGGTPSRNMVNLTEHGLPTDWSIEEGNFKNVKWTADVGGRFRGSPVVADGKVFVAAHNVSDKILNVEGKKSLVMAFRETDGKLLWHNEHDIPKPAKWCDPAPSTPAIDADGVYYVTSALEVVRCDANNGRIRWRYDLSRELKIPPIADQPCEAPPSATPLVVGDLVFVTVNRSDNEEEYVKPVLVPSFVALDKSSGKLKWKFDMPGEKIVQGQWAAPAFAKIDGREQVIFAGGDGVIYGLVPTTGEVIWKCNCLPFRADAKDSRPSMSIMAAPAVVGDKLFFGLGRIPDNGGTGPGRFLCLDLRKKGDVSLKSYDATGPENRDSALIWSYGGPIVPPPKRGPRNNFSATFSSPAVRDGLAYVTDANGFLYCLDAENGRRVWMDDLREGVYGSPLWVDNRIVVASDSAFHIYAHGREAKKVANIDLESSYTWGTPIAANGTFYFVAGSKLYAIANR